MKGLSVTVREDGRALLYCHSGCRFREIVESLGDAEPHAVVIEPATQLGKRIDSD